MFLYGSQEVCIDLPELICFSGGSWQEYEDEIHQIFQDTVLKTPIYFRKCIVKVKFHPETKKKSFTFWHLISEGEHENDRIPCIRRCERIAWIRFFIEQAEKAHEISWWENKRGNNTHVVIWHEIENYAVILAERKGYYLLKTAYVVEKFRAKRFIKERDEYWSKYK